MRFLKYVLAVATLSFFAGAASATPGSPLSGVDYIVLAKPQQTDAGKKVEVLEFFGYFCPHCYALDPTLEAWVKKQGDRIAFKRVHILFHPSMLPIQQMYVTLELMGKTEQVHKLVFDAMHKQRLQLNTDAAVLEFVTTKAGIDKQKYLELTNSFSVQTKMRRAAKLIEDYGVNSVPLLFVDGRFQTAPDQLRASIGPKASETQLHEGLVQVLDHLVDKVIKERGVPAKK